MIQSMTLVFASLGVIQALMLTVYLFWLRPGKRLANVFLGLILLGLSIRIGKSVFNHFYDIQEYHRNLGLAGFLLVGPAYWCYAKLLKGLGTLSLRWTALHFAPAALYLAFCWRIPNDFSAAAYASYALVMLQYFLYLCMGFYTTFPVIKREYPQHARWFSRLTAGLGILWCFYALVSLGVVPYYIGGALTYSILVCILTFAFLVENKLPHDVELDGSLSISEGENLLGKLEAYLTTSEAYLEPRLSLHSTAEALNLDPRELSAAINQNRHTNFSDFINLYRLERAKALLADPDNANKKMLAVALESGFSNTTRFNQVFKHYTQLTPTQFRASHS